MGRSVSKQSLRNTVFRNIWGIMFKYSILLALCLLSLAEAQRRGGRRRASRRGRQDASAGYTAPDDVPVYAASDAVPTYEAAGDDALAALGNSIPGVPGEDYPIYAEVPESGFTCEGQVDGGYYADPEAECQAFHICTADGAGGLAKYSFLWPNGTLFNQNYFICDWWFNFDCSTAEDLYSLNDEIAAEREALAGAASDSLDYYEAPADYAAAAAPAGDYSVEGRTGRRLGGRRNNKRGGRRQGRRG